MWNKILWIIAILVLSYIGYIYITDFVTQQTQQLESNVNEIQQKKKLLLDNTYEKDVWEKQNIILNIDGKEQFFDDLEKIKLFFNDILIKESNYLYTIKGIIKNNTWSTINNTWSIVNNTWSSFSNNWKELFYKQYILKDFWYSLNITSIMNKILNELKTNNFNKININTIDYKYVDLKLIKEIEDTIKKEYSISMNNNLLYDKNKWFYFSEQISYSDYLTFIKKIELKNIDLKKLWDIENIVEFEEKKNDLKFKLDELNLKLNLIKKSTLSIKIKFINNKDNLNEFLKKTNIRSMKFLSHYTINEEWLTFNLNGDDLLEFIELKDWFIVPKNVEIFWNIKNEFVVENSKSELKIKNPEFNYYFDYKEWLISYYPNEWDFENYSYFNGWIVDKNKIDNDIKNIIEYIVYFWSEDKTSYTINNSPMLKVNSNQNNVLIWEKRGSKIMVNEKTKETIMNSYLPINDINKEFVLKDTNDLFSSKVKRDVYFSNDINNKKQLLVWEYFSKKIEWNDTKCKYFDYNIIDKTIKFTCDYSWYKEKSYFYNGIEKEDKGDYLLIKNIKENQLSWKSYFWDSEEDFYIYYDSINNEQKEEIKRSILNEYFSWLSDEFIEKLDYNEKTKDFTIKFKKNGFNKYIFKVNPDSNIIFLYFINLK